MNRTYAPNPHAFDTIAWFQFKECTDGWLPYHVGTTPSGADCRTMPRCVIARPGWYRCPACGKEFETYTPGYDGKPRPELAPAVPPKETP